MRRYASVVYAVIISASPRLSVCLSQVGVLQRWLNLSSHKQCCTRAQGLCFSEAKNLGEIPMGSSPMGALNTGRVG